MQLRKQRTDPNAPNTSRMPLPELRDIDKAERAKALREIARRQQLSADTLPSICHYTIMNAASSVCSIDITDDSSMVALGFADSTVKVSKRVVLKYRGPPSNSSIPGVADGSK